MYPIRYEYSFIAFMSLLNIAYWNIHGFNDFKLDDEFFACLCCKYDVLCFSETMKDEPPRNLSGIHNPSCLTQRKQKREAENPEEFSSMSNLTNTNS